MRSGYRPPPKSPWRFQLRLEDLLFIHWPVPVTAVEKILPDSLSIDTFEDQVWVSVVGLTVKNVRVRWLPPLPVIFGTVQVNVRTYVKMGDSPGVFFLSVDTANVLSAWGARHFLRLPCFHSHISSTRCGDRFDFAATRREGAAELRVSYRPGNEPFKAREGSLEEWLLERYRLYSADSHRRLWLSEIDHAPWSLRPVEAEIATNSMTLDHNISPPTSDPIFHFTPGLETRAWPLEKVERHR